MFVLHCVVRRVSSKYDILGGNFDVSFSCMYLRDAGEEEVSMCSFRILTTL